MAGAQRSASTLSSRDREILLGLAARIDPGDAGGHNNLGVLYFNKGMIEEAVVQFHRALEIDPGMPVALRNLEISYLSTGYYERVLEEVTAALREDPTDRETRWRLVRAHRYSGHLEEAKAELRRLLAASPKESRYLVELGRAEKEAGAFQEAREAYERALAVDPRSAVLHFHLGELQYHQGSSTEALRSLLRAIDLAPGFAEAYHLLSFVLGDLGESDRATEALSRAHELGPWLKDSRAGLSIDRNSVARYEELLGDRPARPVALRDRFLARYHLGVAFRQKGLYEDALREFDRALSAGEDRTLVMLAKAEVLLVAGRDAEASEIYGEFTRDPNAGPKVWNELGVCHHRAGDLVEAKACYRRALEIDPGYSLAENNLAVAYANGGDRPGARVALERLLAAQPTFSDARYNLGLLAMEEGRRRDALAAFREVVEHDPQSGAGWLGIGAILSETDDPQEARKALARAVEIMPDSAEARYRLGFVLSRLGEVESSLRETKQALTLNPYFTTARLKLAIELQFEYAEVLAPELIRPTTIAAEGGLPDFRFEVGELSGIFAGLRGRTAATSGPADYSLARDYLSKGLLVRALAEVRRVALAGGEPVEEALLTGEIYRQQRLEGEALERFDAALGHMGALPWDDDHERAWAGRGWSLLALGRVDSAAKAAREILDHDADSIEGRRLEAETLLSGGRTAESLERFQHLTQTAPRDPLLLMRAGAAARAAGRIEAARSSFQRALELDPHLLAVRVELGQICLEQRAFGEAVEHGRAAFEALPGYAEAALLVAEAERGRGDVEAAVAVLADLLSDDPYHLHAIHRLGEILLVAGRAADAAIAFRRILRFDLHSAAAWALLGDSLAASGDVESAFGCWRRSLAAGPDRETEAKLKRKIENTGGRDAPVRRYA